ncbi:hypothetical protein KXV97_004416, partial [Aspergillus fumigatus]
MAGPTEPIRKRRRPALSCVECRRRKVKCDRNSPCGQCRAHKSTACTYAVAWATGPVRHESQRTQEPLLPEPADQGASEPQQPASSSPNPTIGESTGPGISLVLGGPVRCTPPDLDSTHTLPQKVSVSSSTIQAPPGPFHGILSKTRVFGHGHWMSSVPLVGSLPFSKDTPAERSAEQISEAIA